MLSSLKSGRKTTSLYNGGLIPADSDFYLAENVSGYLLVLTCYCFVINLIIQARTVSAQIPSSSSSTTSLKRYDMSYACNFNCTCLVYLNGKFPVWTFQFGTHVLNECIESVCEINSFHPPNKSAGWKHFSFHSLSLE